MRAILTSSMGSSTIVGASYCSADWFSLSPTRLTLILLLGFLHGRAPTWAQASNASEHLNAEFMGCTSDQGGLGLYGVERSRLEPGWNDPALHSAFSRGLSDPVRDTLVMGSRPSGLYELIYRAIDVDYQRERHRE